MHGIKQKGQSRIWIDDRGWYIIVIEFQPFHGRHGSTLNVGVNFNWYEQQYFSYDIGSRENVDFVEYNQDEDRFQKEIEHFCEIALDKVFQYRENLKNLHDAKLFILNHQFTSENLWGSYHKGTIAGLTNDFDTLNIYYKQLLSEDYSYDWVQELKRRVETLSQKTETQDQFAEAVKEIVKNTRALKKLPPIDINLI